METSPPNLQRSLKQRRKRKAPGNSIRTQNNHVNNGVESVAVATSVQDSSSAATATADANYIHGLSPELSPLLIQAIKSQKRLLLNIVKHYQKQNENDIQSIQNSISASSNSSGRRSVPNNASAGRSAQDDILSRMEREEWKERRKEMMDTIPTGIKTQHEIASTSMNEFIDRLKLEENKEVKKTKRKSNFHSKHTIGDHEENDQDLALDKYSCISCLRFIFDLVQDRDNKLTLRHAAATTAFRIIQQTVHVRESQIFLVVSSSSKNTNSSNNRYPMKKVIDSVELNNNTIENIHQQRQGMGRLKCSDKWMMNQILYQLWKIYNFILKHKLRNKMYDPKMITTMRYIEERKGVKGDKNAMELEQSLYQLLLSLYHPNDSTSFGYFSSTTNNSSVMIENRRIRDIAIKYCDREIKRVDRILRCVNQCMELIVPRFAKESNSIKTSSATHNDEEKITTVKNEAVLSHDKEDDEDDIDWEDGDDEDLLFNSNDTQEANYDGHQENEHNHEAAVENTLAMMRETGALQEGNLQIRIDLSSTGLRSSNSDGPDLDEKNKIEARELLSKCVNLLLDRHQPRIKSWLNALISADNMTSSAVYKSARETRPTNVNVVLLPESARKRKDVVFQAISALSNQISTALSLTMKMGIHPRADLQSERSLISNNTDCWHNSNLSLTTKRESDGESKAKTIGWRHAFSIHAKDERKQTSLETTKRPKFKGKIMIKLRRR